MGAKDWSEWMTMSILFLWRWELVIVTYNVWNKNMNQFFRLHEASEVLNKYIMGGWSGNFTADFFVSFIVTVFVPDIGVAAQLCSPQNAYNVISKKYFDITAHPETKWLLP